MDSLEDGLLSTAVFGQLPATSLCAVAQTDRRLRRLVEESGESLWRDAFRRDFPAWAPPPSGWRDAYRSRLQHDSNWRSGELAWPAETLRCHAGPIFGATFLEAPFPQGLAVSGGVCGDDEQAELTLWEIGRGRYEDVGRLGWRLPSAGLSNLRGCFDVRQRPGTSQLLLCGFGAEVTVASVESLPSYSQQQGQQHEQARPPGQPLGPSPGPPAAAAARRSDPSASAGASGSRSSSGYGGATMEAARRDAISRAAGGGVNVAGGGAAGGDVVPTTASFMQASLSNVTTCQLSNVTAPQHHPGYTLRSDWVLRGHAGACVSASGQAEFVATASFDGSVKLWRLPDGDLADSSADAAGTNSGGAQQQEPTMLSSAATFADPETAEEPGGELHPVCSVALRPDCQCLASGGNDRQVKLWDVERVCVTARMEGHTGWVWHLLALEDDHSVLASGATDSTVRVWDARAGCQMGIVEVNTLEPDNVYPIGGLATRVDRRYIVAGCFDASVHIIDQRMMRVLHSITAHTDRVCRVSCQGDQAISGSFDGNVALYTF